MMKIMRICGLMSGLCGLFLTLLLASCGGKPPTVVYYSLASMEQSEPDPQLIADLDVVLGVGPVTVPEALKKVQIATRTGGNRYHFNEFHRWAGMVEKDISSVLGNNLGLLLNTDRIAFFPWMHYFEPDYRLVVEIIQFDSDLKGDAVLNARWFVNNATGENILASGKSTYRQTLENPSYEALVDAESLVLAAFSIDLAVELKALVAKK